MSYFFFQAEDGIRGKLVTGVQTCALPILRCCARRPMAPSKTRARLPGSARRPPDRSEERRVGKGCYSKWKPSPCEINIFLAALVIAANITNIIVPVHFPASWVAVVDDAQR